MTALGLSSDLVGQQQVASTPVPTPNVAVGARMAARVGARTQAFSTTIQGNALTSTNGQLANTMVRLRDARFGRIIDSQLTDQSGLFAFRTLDPGSYIVEIMGADSSSILAASQILNVNAGDIVSAVVKLPFRLPPFAGILGGSAASTATPAAAAAIVTEAAANGVLVITTPAGAVDSCPIQ
jgi:hypothetical protein